MEMLKGPFYCFRVTLMQWGNRLWSALYSRASFNQNTNPVMLIKHRTTKVFTDVFYNVDFEPLTRVQWIWAICLILFLWCKKKKKKGQGTLKLNSQSCSELVLIPKVHLGKCSLFNSVFVFDVKIRKIILRFNPNVLFEVWETPRPF